MPKKDPNEKVQDFLKELEEVCKKHGFSLAHEDIHGGFIVEKYNRDYSEWLQQAATGHTVTKNLLKWGSIRHGIKLLKI